MENIFLFLEKFWLEAFGLTASIIGIYEFIRVRISKKKIPTYSGPLDNEFADFIYRNEKSVFLLIYLSVKKKVRKYIIGCSQMMLRKLYGSVLDMMSTELNLAFSRMTLKFIGILASGIVFIQEDISKYIVYKALIKAGCLSL
ncbi:hypothetical protein [Aeromonas veronii]|uniref:hypothetical protein n=1 Tax=Aeromonas veronii TaxID=654 RepID=UPI003EC86FF1